MKDGRTRGRDEEFVGDDVEDGGNVGSSRDGLLASMKGGRTRGSGAVDRGVAGPGGGPFTGKEAGSEAGLASSK